MLYPIDKKRLTLEYVAMMEQCSAFQPQLCRDSNGTSLWWEVKISTTKESYDIAIIYLAGFPDCPPRVTCRQPFPPGIPHLMGNRIDLPGIWDTKCTAATAVLRSLKWFVAYEQWLSIDKWPVPDAVN